MESNPNKMLLDRFNATIHQWIVFLDDYSLEMLLQKPKADTWSIGQVFVHLVEATRHFVGQMSAALTSPANSERETHPNARVMLQNNAFPDMQIRGPRSNALTSQPNSKEEILQGLLGIRKKVNQLYSDYDFSGSPGKAEHPGLGYLTAVEWLQFIEMHMRHHLRQKKRIDDELFPEQADEG